MDQQEAVASISLKLFKNPDVACWAIGISKAALDDGHVSILEWLWDGCPQAFWQQRACDYVTRRRPRTLKWLLAQYPPCHWEPANLANLSSIEVLGAIAQHVHLPSPGLLHRVVSCSRLSPDFCDAAAERGNLELLRYLRSRQCQWNGQTCLKMAARHGHLRMLQWMCEHEPSCVWDATLSDMAAHWNHPEVLLWLLRDQPAWPLPSEPEMASARCLALLVQWNCPLNSSAKGRTTTLGPLSPSLVIGLARWQRRCERMGLEAQESQFATCHDQQGRQLLSHLSTLPDDIIMHICILAGMCRPLTG